MPRHSIAPTLLPVLLTGIVACSGGDPEPATAPRPTPTAPPASPTAMTTLRTDWEAVVTLQRLDSLVLTLADGRRQVQRLGRTARFTLRIGRDNSFSVRLDTLALQPASPDAARDATGAVYSGKLGAYGRIEGFAVSKNAPLALEMGNAVRAMLPRIPRAGIRPGSTWSDTTTGTIRVDIFRTDDRRITRWSAGERTTREGLNVLPVRMREEFEQLGRGMQSGRELTMTAQGSGIAVYYLTPDGRIDGASFSDSASKLITIPVTRQSIPTIHFTRTVLRFLPPRDDRR